MGKLLLVPAIRYNHAFASRRIIVENIIKRCRTYQCLTQRDRQHRHRRRWLDPYLLERRRGGRGQQVHAAADDGIQGDADDLPACDRAFEAERCGHAAGLRRVVAGMSAGPRSKGCAYIITAGVVRSGHPGCRRVLRSESSVEDPGERVEQRLIAVYEGIARVVRDAEHRQQAQRRGPGGEREPAHALALALSHAALRET